MIGIAIGLRAREPSTMTCGGVLYGWTGAPYELCTLYNAGLYGFSMEIVLRSFSAPATRHTSVSTVWLDQLVFNTCGVGRSAITPQSRNSQHQSELILLTRQREERCGRRDRSVRPKRICRVCGRLHLPQLHATARPGSCQLLYPPSPRRRPAPRSPSRCRPSTACPRCRSAQGSSLVPSLPWRACGGSSSRRPPRRR